MDMAACLPETLLFSKAQLAEGPASLATTGRRQQQPTGSWSHREFVCWILKGTLEWPQSTRMGPFERS